MEFDVSIKEKDLYKFNLRYNYTSFNGLLTVVLGIAIFVILIMSYKTMPAPSILMYILIVALFWAFPPINYKTRAKLKFKEGEIFSKPLHYKVADDGLIVSSPLADEPSVLPWEYIYKASTSKNYLYIYSSRVNAYILPKDQIINIYPQLKEELETHIKDFKLNLKW